jgi:hypothetical protein
LLVEIITSEGECRLSSNHETPRHRGQLIFIEAA